MLERLKLFLFGAPRDVEDPGVYHKISLAAFLAWVGLGADGLSSSCYGPEQAFTALGSHLYLAVPLAAFVAFTIFVIALCYSRIIEHFPYGGGGYTVATRLLGPNAGVLSGSALLVDYILTISVSIAAGVDAVFSFLPLQYQSWKLAVACAGVLALMIMNIRGVKESVMVLMPIFLLFLVTHAVLIVGTPLTHFGSLKAVAAMNARSFKAGLSSVGLAGLLAIFLRAYVMGAGTFTGIEAVSNGLPIMREPKVETGKRTMLYMALSLALTAGGIMLGYLLVAAHPVPGKTMNAVLIDEFLKRLPPGLRWGGETFRILTLFSECFLLLVAAQAGFIDGPRVMANMANDSWLPHRFSSLSDRLTIQDGVLLISALALVTLLYSGGDTFILVSMYSINVFITFSLSQLSMIRFWAGRKRRSRRRRGWMDGVPLHAVGFVLCFSVLVVSLYEKFREGGWVTLALTFGLIGLCAAIKRHYQGVRASLSRLDEILAALPKPEAGPVAPPLPDAKEPTAILLVGSYRGLGVHALLTILRLFPRYFKNVVFISVGVVDAAIFKGVERVEEMRHSVEKDLNDYIALAGRLGLAAEGRKAVGTDVLDEAGRLCREVAAEYPRSIVFAGKLVFEDEKWFYRLLHNETAYAMQRRLQFSGLNAMVLPVRVMASRQAAPA